MTITRRRALRALVTASVLPTLSAPASAQAGKTLRVLLGYPPGGAVDVVARAVSEGLRGGGYTVVIENRTGASGRLATEQMLAAPPDGSTLVFMPGGNATIFPHVYSKLKYDPFSDLVPIALPGSNLPTCPIEAARPPSSMCWPARCRRWPPRCLF